MSHYRDLVSRNPWCVAISSDWGSGPCILHVHRTRELPNKWGGIGRSHYGDANGRKFASSEEAWAFALSRGYLQRFYRKCHPVLNGKRAYESRCKLRKAKGVEKWWSDEKRAISLPADAPRF